MCIRDSIHSSSSSDHVAVLAELLDGGSDLEASIETERSWGGTRKWSSHRWSSSEKVNRSWCDNLLSYYRSESEHGVVDLKTTR